MPFRKNHSAGIIEVKGLIALITIVLFAMTFYNPVFSQQSADIERILIEGREAYNNGEYEKAIERLTVAVRFLSKKADATEAWVYLALSHFALGNRDDASEAIQNGLKVNSEIQLDVDMYSPKFIELFDEVKKNSLIDVVFQVTPAAALHINGHLFKEGDNLQAKVVKGENTIKAVKEGFKTFERNFYIETSGETIQIELEKAKEPKLGLLEKPAVKPKKKFPWLLVVGGIVVLGVVAYFLFIKKPKYSLTVNLAEGVAGSPANGSYSYKKDETITYNYTTQGEYTNLEVKIDGQVANNSGVIKMDKNHTIDVTAVGNLGNQHTLLVIKDAGVEGDPSTGSYRYNEGSFVQYNYELKTGYQNLLVKLDGNRVGNSGNIEMNTSHTLQATADVSGNQLILTVSKGEGVSGTPDSGSHSYSKGDVVNYSYNLESGYDNLVVTLDGDVVSNSGSFTMNANRTLNATAGGSSGSYILTVERGDGVEGNPDTGSYTHTAGTQVSYNYTLASGYIDLVVKLDGKNVNANGAVTMNSSHNLEASATKNTGSIYVTSKPAGAGIWIGDPETDTGLATPNTIEDLAPGTYRIVVKKKGYKDVVFPSVTVTVGETTNIHADLQKI